MKKITTLITAGAMGLCMAACNVGQNQEEKISILEALSAGLNEPAFDAWVALGENGEVIDSEMIVHPMDDVPVFRNQRRSLTAEVAQSLHPELEEILNNSAYDDDMIEVVISVRSSHRLSFLPRFDRTQDLDSADNLQILAIRQSLKEADGELRALERAPIVKALEEAGARVTDQFRVGNAIAVSLKPRVLKAMLESFPDIISATLAETEEAPAADINDGRDAMYSDQIEVAYNGDGYRIGLLDTGVYNSHETLDSGQINIRRDCVWGHPTTCAFYDVSPYNLYYNAGDPYSSGGHGTSSADIIIGDSTGGNGYRGVAPDSELDSTNVYSGSYHNTLNSTAVLRAFDLLDGYDDVIVANVTSDTSETGTISLAADDLYDEGVVVIAPIGNNSAHDGYSPANAHKVIGTGAYYTTGAGYSGSNGEQTDGRLKPEIASPTYVYAAANTGTTNYVQKSGTCPAAAFLGGASVLLRDRADNWGWSSDPGSIYAAIVAFGDDDGALIGGYDGAGHLKLGLLNSSYWYSGVKYLDPGDTDYVYVWYSGGERCNMRAAIWWEEDYDADHSEHNLYLQRATTTMDSSTDDDSVYQKVYHEGDMSSGAWWRIKIHSNSLNDPLNVKVHYVIHVEADCS
jgi:hypothetical protein